jgi:hypothetical protein
MEGLLVPGSGSGSGSGGNAPTNYGAAETTGGSVDAVSDRTNASSLLTLLAVERAMRVVLDGRFSAAANFAQSALERAASLGSLTVTVGSRDDGDSRIARANDNAIAAVTLQPGEDGGINRAAQAGQDLANRSPRCIWLCIKRGNYVVAMIALQSITAQMLFDLVFQLLFPKINPLCSANASAEDGALYDLPRYVLPFFASIATVLTALEHCSPEEKYTKFKDCFHHALIPAAANFLKGLGVSSAVIQLMLIAGAAAYVGAALIPLQLSLGIATVVLHFIGKCLHARELKNRCLLALLYFTMALDPIGSWFNWPSAISKLADSFSIFFASNKDDIFKIFNATNYAATDSKAWFLGAGLGLGPTAWLIAKSYKLSCRANEVNATDDPLLGAGDSPEENKCCVRNPYADNYKETTHAVSLLPTMFLIYMMGLETAITYILCDFGGVNYNTSDEDPDFSFYCLFTAIFYALYTLFWVGSIRHCIYDCKVNSLPAGINDIELGDPDAGAATQTTGAQGLFAGHPVYDNDVTAASRNNP